MAGLTLLTIGNARLQDPVSLRVGNIAASWQINGPGRLSAILPARLVHGLGGRVLLGRWVLWDHHTMGPWLGIIQDLNQDLFNGTVELGCSSIIEMLRKRRTSRSLRVQSSPAGSQALRMINDANSDQDILIDEFVADEDGDLVTTEQRGDDLLSVIDSLAQASDHEYDVTVDADLHTTFAFRKQIGSDKRGSVLLIEGRDILDGTITSSIYDLVNDRLAVSADQDWARADHAIALDGDSIDLYGRQQDTAEYDYATRRASLYTRALDDIRRLSVPALTATVRVNGDNTVLSNIRNGDTVRLWSATANGMYDFRVRSRAIDDGNVATLAGDLTEGDA